MKFIQILKLLDVGGLTMFVKRFCKTLIFRCKFRTLILTLYPYLFVNLLKVSMKLVKSVAGFWINSSKAFWVWIAGSKTI